MRCAHTAFPSILLLVLTLTCSILQANAQVPTSFPIHSSGMIEHNPTPADGWLHTDGIWVKDAANRTLAWRGFIADWKPQLITLEEYHQRLIETAEQRGLTYVELYFQFEDIAYNPGGWPPAFNFEEMDRVVDLYEQAGIYVVLNWLRSGAIHDDTITELTELAMLEWQKIIEHYKNRPVVCGVKLVDEINCNYDLERQTWLQLVPQVRQWNPNLLVFLHALHWQRIDNLWRTAEDVPEGNVIIEGCAAMSAGNIECPLDDYDLARSWADTVLSEMDSYPIVQSKVCPVGLAYFASNVQQNTDNSHMEFTRSVSTSLEERRWVNKPLASMHLWESYYNSLFKDAYFPDPPYPKYYSTT